MTHELSIYSVDHHITDNVSCQGFELSHATRRCDSRHVLAVARTLHTLTYLQCSSDSYGYWVLCSFPAFDLGSCHF